MAKETSVNATPEKSRFDVWGKWLFVLLGIWVSHDAISWFVARMTTVEITTKDGRKLDCSGWASKGLSAYRVDGKLAYCSEVVETK